MKIAPNVLKKIEQNKVSAPKKKEVSSEVVDSVNISSGKKEVSDDDFKSFLSKGMKKVVDYTKARPTTTGDGNSSAVSAAIGGGVTGWMAGGHPINAAGGVVGGAVGIKVGEKTGSFGKALTASFASGAVANTAAVSGLMLAEAAITGAGAAFDPIGMGVIAAIGGLSGVTGMMEGSMSGEIKDKTTVGLISGFLMSSMGGSPLLSFTGALAGAAGGLPDTTAGKYLASAGTGAVLGALSGVFQGPTGMAVNAAMGATAGVVANTIGRGFGNVQRNATEDIKNATFKQLSRIMPDDMGVKGRVAVGALGGAVMGIMPALLVGRMVGPVAAAVPIVLMSALTGAKVHSALKAPQRAKDYAPKVRDFFNKALPQGQASSIPNEAIEGMSGMLASKYPSKKKFEKFMERAGEYNGRVKDFFEKTLPKEQAAAIPPATIAGFAIDFAQAYEDKEDFAKLTPEQFISDVQQIELQRAQAAAQAAQAAQAQNA